MNKLSFRKEKIRINHLLSYLYITFVLTPYISRNFMYVNIFLGLSWFICVIFEHLRYKKDKINCINVYLFLFLWISWIITMRIIGYSTALFGNYAIQIFYWLPLIMYTYYIKKNNIQHLKNLTATIVLVIMVNALHNIYLNSLYPQIITVITSPKFSYYWNLNFASTIFIFSSMFVVLFLIIFLIKSKFFLAKFITLILIILLLIFIFISGRTTTFILLLITIPLIIYIYFISSLKSKLKYTIVSISIVLIIILSYILVYNVEYFTSLLNNERMEVRILALFGKDGGMEESLLRFDLALMSIKTWLSNPITFIIGIGYHQSINPFDVGVGQHSGFIDILGYYGLFGILLVIKIYKTFYIKCLIKIKDIKMKNITYLMIIVCMLYNVLNNFYTLEMGVIMFIFIPSFYLFFNSVQLYE